MKKRITKIVVTGGPCAGKSSFLSRIDKVLTTRGYRVFLISETATELILGGIKPFGDCMSMYDFQTFVFPTQFAKEDLYYRAAQIVPEEKVVIVCDRGILDNKAYVSEEEFQEILRTLGKQEISVRDSYDAVIHLVTAAQGAEYAYTLSNNSARTETPEQARERDRKTLHAWTGHPHLRVIDNSTDFEGKISRAMNEVYSLLDEPFPLRSQHKFLIKKPSLEDLSQHTSYSVTHVMRTYLNQIEPGIQRRILQVGQDGDFVYYYAERRPLPNAEIAEQEEHIDEKKYLSLLMDADTRFHQLSCKQLSFIYDNQNYRIDLYPFSEDRAIMQVAHTKNPQDLKLPKFLSVIRDVTNDPAYRSHVISLEMSL